MRNKKWFLLLLCACGCTSQLAWNGSRARDNFADELRLEIADVKHTLNSYHVEQAILEEKVKHQETLIAPLKNGAKAVKNDPRIEQLEQKIAHLERLQERMVADIRKLGDHANQAATSLGSCRQMIQECQTRLEEALKIKATLDSISKAVRPSATAAKGYKVRPGDSLEKIARAHQTTIPALKKLNELESDRITIGQELQIPAS